MISLSAQFIVGLFIIWMIWVTYKELKGGETNG